MKHNHPARTSLGIFCISTIGLAVVSTFAWAPLVAKATVLLNGGAVLILTSYLYRKERENPYWRELHSMDLDPCTVLQNPGRPAERQQVIDECNDVIRHANEVKQTMRKDFEDFLTPDTLLVVGQGGQVKQVKCEHHFTVMQFDGANGFYYAPHLHCRDCGGCIRDPHCEDSTHSVIISKDAKPC